jgi:hypothetical protein
MYVYIQYVLVWICLTVNIRAYIQIFNLYTCVCECMYVYMHTWYSNMGRMAREI